MRLTKTIREAFVRAAVNDVPQTDYLKMIREAILAEAVAKLPPKVRAVYDDANLRHWVKTDWHSYFSVTVTHPACDGGLVNLSPETVTKCEEWKRLHKEQEQGIRRLKDNLAAAAESVSTRKALANLLPEFEKYLPADEAQAIRSVPVIANLVADFTKAGWPKAKEQKATA